MATLRDNLRDHPIISILAGIASVATIAGFVIVFNNNYSHSISNSKPSADNFDANNNSSPSVKHDTIVITKEIKNPEYSGESKKLDQEPLIPGNYIANGSDNHHVYFYNAPDALTRRNAFINTQEDVFVDKIANGFGYVEFTNTGGQTSIGWLQMIDLIQKPISK